MLLLTLSFVVLASLARSEDVSTVLPPVVSAIPLSAPEPATPVSFHPNVTELNLLVDDILEGISTIKVQPFNDISVGNLTGARRQICVLTVSYLLIWFFHPRRNFDNSFSLSHRTLSTNAKPRSRTWPWLRRTNTEPRISTIILPWTFPGTRIIISSRWHPLPSKYPTITDHPDTCSHPWYVNSTTVSTISMFDHPQVPSLPHRWFQMH